MTARARIDPGHFQICETLRDAADVLVAEASALVDADYTPWIDTDAYEGAWRVHPFRVAHEAAEQYYDLPANCARCPRSARLFAPLPRVYIASFSRLMPGTRLPPHRDYPKAGILRIHIGLRGSEHAKLALDDELVQLDPGELLIFDHSMQHAAWNDGSAPRDIVLIDYEVSADEAAALKRLRGGVNLGPTAGQRAEWRAPVD